jgi:uncharacterized protein
MDESFFDNLVCPITKGKLYLNNDRCELICKKSQLSFTIKEGIPIMLIDTSKSLRVNRKQS